MQECKSHLAYLHDIMQKESHGMFLHTPMFHRDMKVGSEHISAALDRYTLFSHQYNVTKKNFKRDCCQKLCTNDGVNKLESTDASGLHF